MIQRVRRPQDHTTIRNPLAAHALSAPIPCRAPTLATFATAWGVECPAAVLTPPRGDARPSRYATCVMWRSLGENNLDEASLLLLRGIAGSRVVLD